MPEGIDNQGRLDNEINGLMIWKSRVVEIMQAEQKKEKIL